MAYSTILYEVDDRVARTTFNRLHKMNALSLKLAAEFEEALAVADRDPDVRAVVVTGAGGRAFSAGHDLDDEDEKGKSGERSKIGKAATRTLSSTGPCSSAPSQLSP
ncbi:enoyl-CoA hydratase/isomerase family protein [Bradyrhizobium ivorense]|uniref:enoyl-CoA hydratase/isomerase family protein n=1 Tax=Bradyrhizobium ivorense TaxID=2511166 RepID=UPI0010B43443|nr:enoyl-CoA hydratase-related protein [Bradyrhizobium ivorense]VIO71674.1 putative enoyl-CoA hydratase echA8 [Bradyrhizobium ivorense]